MENNRIDPDKMDLMGRMGRAYYVRCNGPAIHTIVQNYLPVSIGYDSLPLHIKSSPVLTGNDLGKLAGQILWPTQEQMDSVMMRDEVKEALTKENAKDTLHYLAKGFLDRGDVEKGFSLLMSLEQLAVD